ncbi:unnamed protein product [Phytophthora fragariaefolia]|uniref:Unnamed protein product n=1 Tax=Phytophthora fragariaefolia TaxID=1490495 RepID=A0A9W6XU03_9STRA|nr:unnamed protein product [Phytophthora fragariaefolia]
MASPGVTYPPKPFALSAAKVDALELLADQLVAETLRTSDDFISCGRVVDKTQWKTVKKKNNLKAYRARKLGSSRTRRARLVSEDTEAVAESPRMPEFFPSHGKSFDNCLADSYLAVSATCHEDLDSNDEFQRGFNMEDILEQKVMEKAKPDNVPMVFCTGVVPGTIEDAALGFLANTEARTQARSFISGNTIVDDVQILTRIQEPTFDDPFRFMGVKWWAHSTPGAAGRFIKPRDSLVIESSGIALDADGERFCYLLTHSIALDQVPDFKKFGRLRITFSTCRIVRSYNTAGEVEIFCRGFIDSAGSISERLATYLFCESLMKMPRIMEEANKQKLGWLLQSKPHCGSSSLRPLEKVDDTCQSCSEKLGRGVERLLDYSICIICRHSTCRKCTIRKTLLIELGGPKQLTKTTKEFCLRCYLDAKNLSAWEVGMNSLSDTK